LKLESKRVHVEIILNYWTHLALFVKYIIAQEKIENIWCTFDKEKKLERVFKKNISTSYFDSYKHTKGFLRHHKFSWIFCCSNSTIIKNNFKNQTKFSNYGIHMVIFQNYRAIILRIVHSLNITNLLSFIGLYKFCAKFGFHRFVYIAWISCNG
jgi:hypothetical protein